MLKNGGIMSFRQRLQRNSLLRGLLFLVLLVVALLLIQWSLAQMNHTPFVMTKFFTTGGIIGLLFAAAFFSAVTGLIYRWKSRSGSK
jgi:hypothetical protein